MRRIDGRQGRIGMFDARSLRIAAGFALAFSASPAFSASEAPCALAVVEVRPKQPVSAEAGTADIFVTCGRLAIGLGRAASYEASFNAALQSVVVVLKEPTRTRVDLVSRTAEGALSVQDISRDLARLAGRALDTALHAETVDIGDFSAHARVAVVGGARLAKDGISPAVPARGTLDLEPYLNGGPPQGDEAQ